MRCGIEYGKRSRTIIKHVYLIRPAEKVFVLLQKTVHYKSWGSRLHYYHQAVCSRHLRIQL